MKFIMIIVLALMASIAAADQNIVININGEKQIRQAQQGDNVLYQGQFDSEERLSGWLSPKIIDADDWIRAVCIRPCQDGADSCVEAVIMDPDSRGSRTERFMFIKGGTRYGRYTAQDVKRQLDSNKWTYKWSRDGYSVVVIVTEFVNNFYGPELKGKVIITKDASNSSIGNDLSTLEKLSELKDKGIITEDEFNKKKKEILGL